MIKMAVGVNVTSENLTTYKTIILIEKLHKQFRISAKLKCFQTTFFHW